MSAVDIAHALADPPKRTHGEVAVAPAPLVREAALGTASRLSHTIDLRQNRTFVIIATLSIAAICALLAGLWFGQFAKTETARGIVASANGFSRLDAPRAGFIKKIYVAQGNRVESGTPIYLLGIGEANAGGDSATASEMKTLQQSRGNRKDEIERAIGFIATAHEQQQAMIKDQKELNAALDGQEKSVQEALAQSRAKLQRVKELVRQGYATRDIQESYERTYFEYEREYSEVKLKRVEYKRQASDKQRELAILISDKESQRSNAANEINSIDARIEHLKTESMLQVQAQSSGEVLAITGKVGDSVERGQFVAAIGDANAEPVIILDAPARATGLVKVGQKVVLKYDAFPFKTFGVQHGTITSISSAAIRAPATEGDSGLDPRPVSRQSLYRIEVRPESDVIDAYGEKKKIALGSTLSADIIVEKRRLIDWVLDPIRAMRGRI